MQVQASGSALGLQIECAFALVVPWSAHLEEEGLDEAADDEAVDLEAAEPPVADRGSCPHSDHLRGITSEVVQLARGSNPSQPRISRTPWGPVSQCHSRPPRGR